MGEPLKDKKIITEFVESQSLVRLMFNDGKIKSNIHSGIGLFKVSDIKSAVEWLKESLKDFEADARLVIYDKIHQAFPDLQDVKKVNK